MNLFEISGKITLDGDGAIKGINSVTSAAKSAASALAGIAGAGLKVGGAVAGGVATAGAAIVKSAVSSYAEYEQLVGGVETLFGTRGAETVEEYAQIVGKNVDYVAAEFGMLQLAQSTVMNNAANAYKTAGLSANEYMNTVNSFAASLNQSTASELETAEMANMAVIDMADNANKMGTDMAAIQNAYQGFAKQNYTMLDNLKLGYGGTKNEMARLINESGVLGDTIVEVSSMTKQGNFDEVVSFATVVEAIHAVQEELGITGTTAKEAATTITGSTASMKAAWSNLMTGVADENADMDKLVDDFVDAGVTAASNVVPRVATAIRGTMQLGQTLVPAILDQFETYKPQLQEGFYSLVTDGLNFAGFDVEQTDVQGTFESIFGGVGDVGNTLKTELGGIKDTFVKNLGEIGTVLSDNGVSIDGFFSGISETLSTVAEPINAGIDTAMKGITKLTDWATTDGTTLNTVLSEGAKGFKGFSEGLTGFLEATGYLIEGDTDKAGETLIGTLNKTPAGTVLTSVWESLFNPPKLPDGMNPNAVYWGGTFNPLNMAENLGLQSPDTEAPVYTVEELNQKVQETKDNANITPQVDTTNLEQLEIMYGGVAQQADELDSKVVSPQFDMGDDLAKAEAMYGGVASAADALDGTSTSLTVEAQGADTAAAEIEAAASATEAADGSTATIEVEAEGAETAAAEIDAVTNAASQGSTVTVSVNIDTSASSQAAAVLSQTAAAIQSAFEFSLATPAVDTSSFGDAVAAASAAAAAIQAAFASISISIPAPSIGGGGAGGGVSATSAGGGTPAVAAAGVEGYASGAVLLKPTEFGFNPYTNNRMIAGEAGPEAIAPISTLQSYVGEAVAERDAEQGAQLAAISAKLDRLDDLIDVASQMTGMSLKVNGREFGRLVKQTK